MLNVVIFNGGRGATSIIPSLLKEDFIHITSIVNAYDDGKSTGEIRKYFQMLGPSDLRKAQELMLNKNSDYQANSQIFSYRFSQEYSSAMALQELNSFVASKNNLLCGILIENEPIKNFLKSSINSFLDAYDLISKVVGCSFNFADCSLMNIVYAGAFLNNNRDFDLTVSRVNKLFNLLGNVVPTNNENKVLVGIREDGTFLYNEAEIVELRSNTKVKRVYLLDQYPVRDDFEKLSFREKEEYLNFHHTFVNISSSASLAIRNADLIIYAPGTQHSSLYPSYMTKGVSRDIASNSKAAKVFISNIGADFETPSYQASDYISGAYRYLNLPNPTPYNISDLIHFAFVNDPGSKSEDYLVPYDHKQCSNFGIKIIADNFEDTEVNGRHNGDLLVKRLIELIK